MTEKFQQFLDTLEPAGPVLRTGTKHGPVSCSCVRTAGETWTRIRSDSGHTIYRHGDLSFSDCRKAWELHWSRA